MNKEAEMKVEELMDKLPISAQIVIGKDVSEMLMIAIKWGFDKGLNAQLEWLEAHPDSEKPLDKADNSN